MINDTEFSIGAESLESHKTVSAPSRKSASIQPHQQPESQRVK